jgi:hypothetical protein
VVVP